MAETGWWLGKHIEIPDRLGKGVDEEAPAMILLTLGMRIRVCLCS
jgi:hypothetical protein